MLSQKPMFSLTDDSGKTVEFDLVQLYKYVNRNGEIHTTLTFPQLNGTFTVTEAIYIKLARDYGYFIGMPEDLFNTKRLKEHYKTQTPLHLSMTPKRNHIEFPRDTVVFQIPNCKGKACFLNQSFEKTNKPFPFKINVFGKILNANEPASFEYISLSNKRNVKIKRGAGEYLDYFSLYIKPYPRIGICNWGGTYTIGPDPILIDGSKAIRHLKFENIKLYAGNNLKEAYNISPQDNAKSLYNLMLHPQYKHVLEMDFKVIALVCFSMFSGNDDYWKKSTRLTDEELQSEEKEFHSLSEHLHAMYPNKKFILQNWESDNAIFLGDEPPHIKKTYLINLSDLINARVRGIKKSKAKNVYSALEVNAIKPILDNPETAFHVANTIMPHLNVDYVSYSCYDSLFSNTQSGNTHDLEKCIDYLEENVSPVTKIYIGEWGYPLLSEDIKVTKETIRNALSVFADKEIPIHFYWQIYDNEEKGFFIIRPDNTLSLAGIELI